jgi:hypothetical protein
LRSLGVAFFAASAFVLAVACGSTDPPGAASEPTEVPGTGKKVERGNKVKAQSWRAVPDGQRP